MVCPFTEQDEILSFRESDEAQHTNKLSVISLRSWPADSYSVLVDVGIDLRLGTETLFCRWQRKACLDLDTSTMLVQVLMTFLADMTCILALILALGITVGVLRKLVDM